MKAIFNSTDELNQTLVDLGFYNTVYFTDENSFLPAIIGIDMSAERLIYDYWKMVDWYMRKHNLADRADAVDKLEPYMDFIDKWNEKHKPIIMDSLR